MTASTNIDHTQGQNVLKHGFLKQLKQLLIAMLASSLSVVPLYLIIAVFTGDLLNSLLPVVLLVAPIIAFACVLIVGLPLHFLLVWQRLLRPIYYGIVGFGIPAVFVLVAQPFGDDGIGWVLIQALFHGAFGAIVSLIFRHFALNEKSAA